MAKVTGCRLRALLSSAPWCGALLMALPACRDLSICESDAACHSLTYRAGTAGDGQTSNDAENAGDSAGGGRPADNPQDGLAGGSQGGTAGSAGRHGGGGAVSTTGGSGECAAPYANCDSSSLTGCETDTSRSAPHCGGCGKKCTGICKAGHCLRPTSLLANTLPPVGGLVRAGESWYALTSSGLISFDEATKQRSVRLSGPTGFNRLEAGLDRVYLGVASDAASVQPESSWWSLPYVGGAVSDEQLTASAVAFVSGNLYFLQSDQTLYRKDPLGGQVAPYCKLPAPAFEFVSASIALPVIFRTGRLGTVFDSDIVDCSPSAPQTEAPIQGKVIHQSGYRDLRGLYENGMSYWDEFGTRLNVTDASGATRVLFDAIRDEDKLTDFVVHGRFAYVSWGGSSFGGLRIIPIEEPDYFEMVGTYGRPTALVVDTELDRLCYFDNYLQYIACIPFADLSP